MNEKQEQLFNTIFKDINININIKFFKNIFIYACNIYSNINKININLIIDKFCKNNFEYNFKKYKNIYKFYLTKYEYDFKYFKIINADNNVKIKFDNILNKKFIFFKNYNYIHNFRIEHYLFKNNICYIRYKTNPYRILNNVLINTTNYLYIKKLKYINNILIYKNLYFLINYIDLNFLYLSNNRLKRLKTYNDYDKKKQIFIIKYKSKIYYTFQYNYNKFKDNSIIFFDSFYTTNKIKTLI